MEGLALHFFFLSLFFWFFSRFKKDPRAKASMASFNFDFGEDELDEDIQKLGLGGGAGNAQDENRKREGQAAEKGPRVEVKELKFDDLVSKPTVFKDCNRGMG